MSETEETPQQRQIRIRQAKREAKLKASAQERLDKITQLSGRTPESKRNESPVSTPPASSVTNGTPTPASRTPQTMPPLADTTNTEQARIQEEYFRALLASANPQAQQGQTSPEAEDPMLKMLQSMMAGMSGDPNAANEFPFSPDDLAKSTGLPSFLTSMLIGGGGQQQKPASPAEIRTTQMWKIIHLAFAIMVGLYTVFVVERTTATFGQNPPAPATFQNPFVIFTTGELLVYGSRIAMFGSPGGSSGGSSSILSKMWGGLQVLKDVGRDGAILVFMLGFYRWWSGGLS